jgi:3-hydroxyisobutyrate dehydrogenase-like beta-hydroxyacid dehydrogenase
MKQEANSPLAGPIASEATSSQGRSEIGFVGLGHMGTAMAANLIATGHRVVAYVRRPDQVDKLAKLGIEPTTELSDLFDRKVVISMLRTTPPFAMSCSGKKILTLRVSARD